MSLLPTAPAACAVLLYPVFTAVYPGDPPPTGVWSCVLRLTDVAILHAPLFCWPLATPPDVCVLADHYARFPKDFTLLP